MGTAGCNMGCIFCQNWDTSKAKSDQVCSADLPPRHVVELALGLRLPRIALTYNEPTIWVEYAIDIARDAHEAGINTVMVSNGYITRMAFFDIYRRYIDAANIDLKALTEKFYCQVTLTHLQRPSYGHAELLLEVRRADSGIIHAKRMGEMPRVGARFGLFNAITVAIRFN